MNNSKLVKLEKPDLSNLSYGAIRTALIYDSMSPYARKLIDFIVKQEEETLEREEAYKRYCTEID